MGRPETSNMEGASGVTGVVGVGGGGRKEKAGEEGEHGSSVGLRWLVRDEEGRGPGASGGHSRRKDLGRRGATVEGGPWGRGK